MVALAIVETGRAPSPPRTETTGRAAPENLPLSEVEGGVRS